MGKFIMVRKPAGGGCAGQTEITYGTPIGDMIEQGGLAGAFDNVTTQLHSGGASLTTTSAAYVGDDAGAGNSHSINGVKIWGSSNAGYYSGTVNFDVALYGSNSAPTGPTDGTKIIDLELNHTGGNATDPLDYTSSPTWTPVAYRYNWVTITPISPSGGDAHYFAELELYECT